MLESTVAWIRGLSLPVSISGHTRLYTSIATSCLNSRGRERSVDPVMVRRFSRIGFREMFTYISSLIASPTRGPFRKPMITILPSSASSLMFFSA